MLKVARRCASLVEKFKLVQLIWFCARFFMKILLSSAVSFELSDFRLVLRKSWRAILGWVKAGCPASPLGENK